MSNADLKFFVGGIPSDAAHKELFDFFRTYGIVKRVTLFNSADSGKRLYGFCFVKFKKLFGGYLDTNQPFYFRGRNLEIDPLAKRSVLKKSVKEKHEKRVFLQNVPSNFTKDDILEIFSQFGCITNCFIIDRQAQGKGGNFSRAHLALSGKPKYCNYGYIIFKSKDDAAYLVAQRYVELENHQKIYVKKYCSTIHRQLSDDGDLSGKDKKSVINPAKINQPGASKLEEPRKRDHNFLKEFEHHKKPTHRDYYFGGKIPLAQYSQSNIRFNVCLGEVS